MLYISKIPTKFDVFPQNFCQNQNPVQDQDQNYDFILDFNSRITYHTYKTATKLLLDALTPSKVIVHPDGTHGRTYIQTDSPTGSRFFCSF